MPISATTISEPGRSGGFTLLELLVVVVLVAILLSTVVLGFTGADVEQRLRGQAEQIAHTIDLARQYALQRNREWGLYVERDAVTFAEFDPEQNLWVTQAGRTFGAVGLLPEVVASVESEGMEGLPSAERERFPKVILYSSGEVTPFTLRLEPQWQSPAWEISSDGLSPTRAERAEY